MTCEFCELTNEDFKDLLFTSDDWKVFLSKDQTYLGRSIVVLNRHTGSLSDLYPEEWMALQSAIIKIESVYRRLLGAQLFNWTCLMNDAFKQAEPQPHVHLHVRPRYAIPPMIEDNAYPDPNFGHHYQSHPIKELSAYERERLLFRLREAFQI